jgi:hypothetical protein
MYHVSSSISMRLAPTKPSLRRRTLWATTITGRRLHAFFARWLLRRGMGTASSLRLRCRLEGGWHGAGGIDEKNCCMKEDGLERTAHVGASGMDPGEPPQDVLTTLPPPVPTCYVATAWPEGVEPATWLVALKQVDSRTTGLGTLKGQGGEAGWLGTRQTRPARTEGSAHSVETERLDALHPALVVHT